MHKKHSLLTDMNNDIEEEHGDVKENENSMIGGMDLYVGNDEYM